ncbi:PaaI family thioesterase [Nitratireductor sp. XY-223]|uniref:PaaI family thioesterase n=1 Tax=Nitratireductor sp. XY-223 TaxID=2561926 RepID=UPI0010AB4102|nr:PaaI family thioesterase [Nitratireductor sp. XY-223]
MKISIPETVDEWNSRGDDYLPGHLGIVFHKVDPDLVEARFSVMTSLMAWNGFLHAGSVVTLADTCCGYGTLRSLPAGADGFTTVDLVSNFLGTARDGHVLCRATPLHKGRTTQVWDAVVTAEESGKTMAHFRCTQMILWPRPES